MYTDLKSLPAIPSQCQSGWPNIGTCTQRAALARAGILEGLVGAYNEPVKINHYSSCPPAPMNNRQPMRSLVLLSDKNQTYYLV